MDTISGLSKLERHETLLISTPTPHSSKSNITQQEQPCITNTPTGDIPPPQFMNSINDLRSYSTALSAFLSRYDELHSHLNFIKSSIDFKLRNHVVDTTNPNQSAVTRLLETSCDQIVTDFLEVTVSEQNPKQGASECERSHAIARTPENTNFLHDFEEIDTSKKPEVVDESKKPVEIDTSKKRDEDDVSKKLEEIDVLKNVEEIDESKKHAESDSSKTLEETVPETSRDQTVTAVPDAIVSVQNPNGIATICEQSHENMRTPEIREEIDATKKPEVIDTSKKPEETDILNKSEEIDILKMPEQTDIRKDSEEIDTSMNPEEIRTSKNPEEIDASVIPEEIDTSMDLDEIDTPKKHEETGIRKKTEEINGSMKPEETEKTSKKSIISRLESLCRGKRYKLLRKHISTHYSKMNQFHKEIAKALKLAKDPAKLVLKSIGRFFMQSTSAFSEGSHQNDRKVGRLASVLILECFVMISSDGIKIAKRDHEYAAKAAADWRNRIIREGGLRHTDKVDARGLLLLISGFGIQDHVFEIRDILDLIRASNVKGISTALRRSAFLIPRIPEVIHLLLKNNLEIEAADIAYTFGLEDKCHPRNILVTYLHKKIKDVQSASSFQMLEAVKQHLFDLKSVKRCLESHNVVPSMLLPDFNIDEKIQNLEKEINEWSLIQNRKSSSENPIHHESKHGGENDALKKLEEIDELKKHAESDTLKTPEETVPETSCDETVTAAPAAIVSEQNANGIATICERSHENMMTPEILEEIDATEKPEVIDTSKKPEETDVLNKSEEIDILKKPEQTDIRKNSEEIDTSMNPEEVDHAMNPEEIRTSKNPEEIDASMIPEEIDTSMDLDEIDSPKKHEETGIRKKTEEINGSMKPEETEKTSQKSIISGLESLCQDMSPKLLKKHISTHYSKMNQLHKEIAKALKLAKDPAKLVLNSIGRFFMQSTRAYSKGSHQNDQTVGRLASVLILECFVMISSDGIEIAKRDHEYAAEAAVDWRNRMIRERGLRHTDEVDARGLLLLISGFGIQDHVFEIQDILDLIRASNVKGISTALRRSAFLIPKIPEVIHLLLKNNLEIEAADIAYTFGLEDKCHPRNILVTYLHKKIKDVQNASSFEMLEAVKQHLFDLNSVKQCLESHNVDPSMLLPDFNIDEKIQNLEKEINEWKSIPKRKSSSENPVHHDSKRACFSSENMPRQHIPVDHYGMKPYNRSTQPSTSYFDFDRNRCNSYITNRSPSFVYHAPAMPENLPGSVPNGPSGGFPGSYDQMVHQDHVQPYYGWNQPYGQQYSRHGEAYDPQPYGRPWGWGSPEPYPHVPPSSHLHGRRAPSSDLYRFADKVEKESCNRW